MAVGVFITLEGPDGAGKSSQAELLAADLREAGLTVVLTREPGGSTLGERIRQVLLDNQSKQHHPLADALLFNAARRQLVSEIIEPALAAGAVVICDRFADSTLAYQGFAGRVPLATLRQIAEYATSGLRPVRTVLLDLPPDAGLARRAHGPADGLTRFELDPAHDLGFHQRVRDGYLQLASEEPDRWRVVDAARDSEQVARDVRQAVSDVLPAI
ncbi:dTMP kinase [soil metagenome]